MDNSQLLRSLEQQRDALFVKINQATISKLYKEEYNKLKSGRVFVFDTGEREMLNELKQLSKDTSLDLPFKNKLAAYETLDNEELINHFQHEFISVLSEIAHSGKQDDIQAMFIEYDFYYHFTGSVTCYGKQDYPLVEHPRYISDEYDNNNQVLVVNKNINFEPAWVSCEEFDELEHLEINYELEDLFRLHSRTLLHKALDRTNSYGELHFLKVRPFTFYINEHDMEVMTLYRLT